MLKEFAKLTESFQIILDINHQDQFLSGNEIVQNSSSRARPHQSCLTEYF